MWQEADSSGVWAILTVTDQGIGIPDTETGHVFEHFYRGSNVGRIGGTGIGLAGSRQIVQQHGGTLVAESKVGIGTTVTMRLPLQRRQRDDGAE